MIKFLTLTDGTPIRYQEGNADELRAFLNAIPQDKSANTRHYFQYIANQQDISVIGIIAGKPLKIIHGNPNGRAAAPELQNTINAFLISNQLGAENFQDLKMRMQSTLEIAFWNVKRQADQSSKATQSITHHSLFAHCHDQLISTDPYTPSNKF